MASITDYISSVAVGSKASDLTGKPADGFTAGGFAAFIQSVTGSVPQIVALPNRRARIIMTQEQKIKMQKWLDGQLAGSLAKPKVPPSLEIEMNPVLIPWALKYVIPLSIFLFITGWLAHWYTSR